MVFPQASLFPACRVLKFHSGVWLATCLVFLLLPWGSFAGLLLPLEGGGNFHSYCDVLNRWQDKNHLDVLVLFEITNADIKYVEVGSSLVGHFNLEVVLEGPDGQRITKERHLSTPRLDGVLAASRTSFQVFGLVLEDVPFRSGRITCRLTDVNARPIGNSTRSHLASSESVANWQAEENLRIAGGVTVGDPLFLAHAPMKTWDPDLNLHQASVEYLHDFVHPSRRYGLEQDRLQLFIPVWPALDQSARPEEQGGLLIQIVSTDMHYSLTDTLEFDNRGQATLLTGRPAGLFYELDMNLLPEGTYRLAIAPLGGVGKGQLVMFDIVWRLSALGRHHDQVLGEGRLALVGKQRDVFLAASPAGQEKILTDFWASLDPNPEEPFNPVYQEFQYRLAFVRNFLGGFGPTGAFDPRGEVYLLLGEPDDVERKVMPMNAQDLADAQIKTFQNFAPDREGSWAKGEFGLQANPVSGGVDSGDSGIHMPRSEQGERQIRSSLNSPSRYHGYELWKYDSGGEPLFTNYLMDRGLWQRFLFVDWTGSGDYVLESSNILQGGD